MGATPSVTAVLVDATPYRLRYLLTSQGQPGAAVLTNENALPAPGATTIAGVDLRFNARTGLPVPAEGLPLFELLGTAVANQAEARRLLLGEGGTPPAIVGTGEHIQCVITPRTIDTDNPGSQWLVDANEGNAAGIAASAGFGVLLITPPAAEAANEEAYLDVHRKYSVDR